MQCTHINLNIRCHMCTATHAHYNVLQCTHIIIMHACWSMVLIITSNSVFMYYCVSAWYDNANMHIHDTYVHNLKDEVTNHWKYVDCEWIFDFLYAFLSVVTQITVISSYHVLLYYILTFARETKDVQSALSVQCSCPTRYKVHTHVGTFFLYILLYSRVFQLSEFIYQVYSRFELIHARQVHLHSRAVRWVYMSSALQSV